ncbi:histidine phosphatase family protein [Tropicimonas sp. TH_r6]|uniref:histidine phosphatase family protein n=1 Tax=Tropicimonas sp. TH_r6 TaxID=3082085 RepID=UPI0029537D08|nr:histidine phosphatase family protein [Tropicimonas sp. TH_r6]MDV7142138.1 histidine phosphatase family protein [Tropicimonas sp. TH_r6]
MPTVPPSAALAAFDTGLAWFSARPLDAVICDRLRRCKPNGLSDPSSFWQAEIMRQVVRYLSHPQVLIDPAIPVPNWGLNDLGKGRVAALAASKALAGTQHVISSAETKAIETATPLATALGCRNEVREAMHENDRSATGFLPPEEFEIVADQFFANPDRSVRGWETATNAQNRIVTEVQQCLSLCKTGDVLFVGHGGVGTLLYCYLSGHSISRDFDQGSGGGGCYFEFSHSMSKPKSRWQPLEKLID